MALEAILSGRAQWPGVIYSARPTRMVRITHYDYGLKPAALITRFGLENDHTGRILDRLKISEACPVGHLSGTTRALLCIELSALLSDVILFELCLDPCGIETARQHLRLWWADHGILEIVGPKLNPRDEYQGPDLLHIFDASATQSQTDR